MVVTWSLYPTLCRPQFNWGAGKEITTMHNVFMIQGQLDHRDHLSLSIMAGARLGTT